MPLQPTISFSSILASWLLPWILPRDEYRPRYSPFHQIPFPGRWESVLRLLLSSLLSKLYSHGLPKTARSIPFTTWANPTRNSVGKGIRVLSSTLSLSSTSPVGSVSLYAIWTRWPLMGEAPVPTTISRYFTNFPRCLNPYFSLLCENRTGWLKSTASRVSSAFGAGSSLFSGSSGSSGSL